VSVLVDVARSVFASSVVAMRRTLPLLVTASLLFVACSSDDDNASDDSTEETAAPDGVADDPDESSDTSAGSDEPSETTDAGAVEPPPVNADKPEVEVPDEIPTELVVTVIEEGSGPTAESGDTVVVDYVGVRTRDGVEFDNSYDRFEPFSVALGQGGVIAGWDQGLVGTQTGTRVRLDIPSDLAYGAEARGDIIGENEALTFLIDVRAVIKIPDAADAPTEPGVPPSEGATETTSTDLVEGDGPELEAGQTAVINYVLFRGDNQVPLESNWDSGPVPVPTAEGGFPGFVNGLPGMNVGGRRAIVVPPADAFGPDGNPQLGLPAGTDLIIVVDLLGAYGQPTG
jgi:FKBP-type peptidyl-prolyl cis-trans isomerase